jgi:hypothetical protein
MISNQHWFGQNEGKNPSFQVGMVGKLKLG